MKNKAFFGLLLLILIAESGLSQGITRSNGLGLRLNYWNLTGRPTRVTMGEQGARANVDISGMGVSIYYFSRAFRNVYMEMSLGAVGGVQAEHNEMLESDVSVESIVPLLVGLRYDVTATRLPGALHPYVTGGGGPYWAFSVRAQQRNVNEDPVITEGGSFESRVEYGWYFGGGVNFVLTNWFTLNADLKYHNIDYPDIKDYSGLELAIGLAFMWGQKREIYEIKSTRLVVQDIYPMYYQFYSTYPLALVSVQNLIGRPIEVNIRCTVRGFSQKPKNSGFVRIDGGETRDIPVTAFFDRRLMQNRQRNTALLDLDVEVRAAATHREDINAQIVIHSRNAWNGDMDKLAYFLTPENETIRDIARRTIMQSDSVSGKSVQTREHAKALFNFMASEEIRYLSDPNIPYYQDDRVQFAEETLDIKSGDCDDLVVLYASLLESVGISTAFVDVRDPEKELAHLYLMFNTGVPPENGHLISSNEKRYVVRQDASGRKRIWIPVETTLLQEGFEPAWNAAALSYLQDGMLRNGISEGWVQIIDHF